MSTHRLPARVAGLLAAGTALAALAGCGASTAPSDDGSLPDTAQTTTATESQSAAPASGGTLVVALDQLNECIDPWQTDVPANHNVFRQVTETLTSIDPETGELRPWLADSWSVNDEATEFTFTLRDGVHFSNGEELTPDVVKQNFDQASTYASAVRAPSYLAGYTGTEVVDDHTVKVTFEAPNASFLNRSASNFLAILAPETLAATPEARCSDGVIGTGPFAIESYQQNQQVVLVARDDYDSAPEWAAHDGPAYLDGITFLIVPESSSRLGLVTSGQAQVTQSLEAQDFATAEAAGVSVDARVTPGVPLRLQVNTQDPLLADEAVRQAINTYLDRDEINEVVFGGQSTPATTLLTPNVPGSADLSDLVAYDPAKGDEILTGDGWAKGADGIWAKDGQPLTFKISKSSPYSLSTPLLELVVQQLRTNGIDATFFDETGDFAEVTSKHLYQIFFSNTTDIDPDVLRGQISPLGGNRSNLLEDDPLAEPLTRQNQLGSWDDRAALLADIQRQVVERAIQIPVAALVQFYGVADTVTGVGYDVESRVSLYDAQLAG